MGHKQQGHHCVLRKLARVGASPSSISSFTLEDASNDSSLTQGQCSLTTSGLDHFTAKIAADLRNRNAFDANQR
eukprot:1780891-Amphidinium_carterae.5